MQTATVGANLRFWEAATRPQPLCQSKMQLSVPFLPLLQLGPSLSPLGKGDALATWPLQAEHFAPFD